MGIKALIHVAVLILAVEVLAHLFGWNDSERILGMLGLVMYHVLCIFHERGGRQ